MTMSNNVVQLRGNPTHGTMFVGIHGILLGKFNEVFGVFSGDEFVGVRTLPILERSTSLIKIGEYGNNGNRESLCCLGLLTKRS
jgi:hypothetical protein